MWTPATSTPTSLSTSSPSWKRGAFAGRSPRNEWRRPRVLNRGTLTQYLRQCSMWVMRPFKARGFLGAMQGMIAVCSEAFRARWRPVVRKSLAPWFSTLVMSARIGAAAEPPPDFLWAAKAGGSDIDIGYGIAADASGNVYVTGFFSGTATFGSTNLSSSGLEDIFVAKYDAAGTLQWARQAGGSAYDEGLGIAVDGTGNVFVIGFFQGNASFGP